MASPSQPHAPSPVNPDTLITLKIVIDGNNRRFKLALRDLGANVLPQKVRLQKISDLLLSTKLKWNRAPRVAPRI
jgi:hypothetical protein